MTTVAKQHTRTKAVLKDAGVGQTFCLPCRAPMQSKSLLAHLKYTKLTLCPRLPCWDTVGRRGADSHSGAVSSVPSQICKESSKIQQMPCCHSGISSRRRCSGRLGKNWEISEGGRAGKFSDGGAPGVGMRGSLPTSLVTLNQVPHLFDSEKRHG